MSSQHQNRPKYEPPRALRLTELQAGSGGVPAPCVDAGSGNTSGCQFSGNSADGAGCEVTGNSAVSNCTVGTDVTAPTTY